MDRSSRGHQEPELLAEGCEWSGCCRTSNGFDFHVLADVQSSGAALESGAVEAIEMFDPSSDQGVPKAKAEQGQYQMYTNQNREEAVQFIGFEHREAAVRRSTGARDRRVRA